MRRIARYFGPADVIGIIGLLLLAYGASLFDPRLPVLVIGAALILVAVAYAVPDATPPAPPAPPADAP
jgi:hypothetical protein